ncbi:MAG TPA: 50S ribosomal protein L25 [Actinomycetota bacterium]
MEVKLAAEKREESGKGPARRARAAGRVPGVLYGPQLDPVNFTVDLMDLWHALHTAAGVNVLVDLKVDGEEYLTMPREVQRDILKGTLLHVDFIQIDRNKPIQVHVPIVLTGEAEGQKAGGVVEHHLWELHVEVLPLEVPESVEADITELEMNDTLHVSDLTVPEGATVLSSEEEPVVSIVPPPVIELPEPEVEEEELLEGEEGELVEGEEAGEAAEGEGGEAPAEEGESEEG